MHNLLVSIITPCFNHGAFIQEMLDSIYSQTYQNFEIIIVNDGSTDEETVSILNQINHPQVQLIHAEHLGASLARNKAISIAKGVFILPVDADDKIAPTYLEKAVNVFKDHDDVGIVYSRVRCFGRHHRMLQLPDFSLSEMLKRNLICASAMFRKKDWELVGGFSEALKYALEDYDFWLSLIEFGRKVYRIPEILFFYRKHDDPKDSRSKRKDRYQRADAIDLIYMRHQKLYTENRNVLFEIIHALRYKLIDEKQKSFWGKIVRQVKSIF